MTNQLTVIIPSTLYVYWGFSPHIHEENQKQVVLFYTPQVNEAGQSLDFCMTPDEAIILHRWLEGYLNKNV